MTARPPTRPAATDVSRVPEERESRLRRRRGRCPAAGHVPRDPALVTAHRPLDDQHSVAHQQIRYPVRADLWPDDSLTQRVELGHGERLLRRAVHDYDRRNS